MPTPSPHGYIATLASSLTTPPGSPRILIHTRQGKDRRHLLRPARQKSWKSETKIHASRVFNTSSLAV